MLINAERQDVLVRDDPAPARAELAAIIRGLIARVSRLAPGRQRAVSARARAIVVNVATQPGKPQVLFACQGNICRSPYAAAVLRTLAGDAVSVTSAGMMPRPGRCVPDLFREQASQNNIDLTDHRSTWVNRESAASASLIVLFDRVNQAAFADRYPNLRCADNTLGDLIDIGEIQDPVDGDARVAALSYSEINRAVAKLALLLKQ